MVKRFDVFMMNTGLNDKPCLVVSPNELNDELPYVIIAPITLNYRNFPTRIGIGLKGKKAYIALDLIQTIDKKQLKSKMGFLPEQIHQQVANILQKMFTL